jgi:hypothetical protein
VATLLRGLGGAILLRKGGATHCREWPYSRFVPDRESALQPAAFFTASGEHAQRVVEAAEGWDTSRAGIAFQGLATSVAASSDAPNRYPNEPMALYLIWGSLTDEMDAPGRESPDQDAAAVRHMRQAATEWLAVVGVPENRAAYCDRWVYEESGYARSSPEAKSLGGKWRLLDAASAPRASHMVAAIQAGRNSATIEPAYPTEMFRIFICTNSRKSSMPLSLSLSFSNSI